MISACAKAADSVAVTAMINRTALVCMANLLAEFASSYQSLGDLRSLR